MEGKLELISRYDEYYLVKSISNEDISLDDILLHNESGRIISVNRFGESNGSKTIMDTGVRNPIELVISGNTFKKLIGYYSKYQKLPLSKLSHKNCQAIAYGYDLDELAKYFSYNQSNEDSQEWFAEFAFKEGFQKALEILGDKKFTEDDMIKMFFNGRESLDKALVNIQEAKSVIQSLQQTKWNVEICCYLGNGDKESDSFKDRIVTNTGIPKLDADGCLILKRK